jgi:DNA-binding HxlR family transcriptional regulator
MKKQFRSLYPRNVETGEGQPVNYCGIRCSLEVLGGKWKLLIVAELFKGVSRYTELRKAIPEISEKMLVHSLQELEYHQIVERKVISSLPPHVEYTLTDYGLSVRPLLKSLLGWGNTHISQHADKIFI